MGLGRTAGRNVEWNKPYRNARTRPNRNAGPRLKPNALARLVRVCCRAPVAVLASALFLSAVAAAFAILALRADTAMAPRIAFDAKTLAAEIRLATEFPGANSFFLATVELKDPGKARETAARIAETLSKRDDLFANVAVPGLGPFYDTYGVLFANAEDIEANVSAALRLQPLYHALGSAPDIAGLTSLVAEVSRAVEQGRSPTGLAGLLEAAAASVEAELKGGHQAIDWRSLLGLSLELKANTWFVIAGPQPGREREAAAYTRGISRGIAGIDWVWPSNMLAPAADPVTGYAVPALLAAIVGAVFLCGGLGSLRLALAVALAVIVSVSVTAGVAAAVAPMLDRVTWTFPAVAFAAAIVMGSTFMLSYVQFSLKGSGQVQAIMLAAHDRGGLILAQAAFFAVFWLPWMFRHIGSLADLAGLALVAIFASAVAVLTVIPAALVTLGTAGSPLHVHWFDDAVAQRLSYHASQLLHVCVMILIAGGVFCAVFLPGLKFGEHVTPAAPPVRLESPDNRGAVHFIGEAGDPALALIGKLKAAPEAGAVRWIEQFMPPDSERKIDALRQLSSYLPGLPSPRIPATDAGAGIVFNQLDYNSRQVAASPIADPRLREAAHRLRRAVTLFTNPQLPRAAQVLALEDSLFSGLAALARHTEQLAQLKPPSVAMLEPGLARRFVSQSGLWRIEVMPRPGVGQLSFAAAMRKIDPGVAGEPIVAIARNEIMHHEAYLAFAAAVAASVIIALVYLRDIALWLLAILPLAFFFTISSALAASFGWLVGGAGLAAATAGAALCLAAGVSLAERAGRIAASSDSRNTGFRAATLPLLVLASVAAALSVSTAAALSGFASAFAALLLTALGLNVFLVPQCARWLRNLGF